MLCVKSVYVLINEPWVHAVLGEARVRDDVAAVVRRLGANREERVRPTCEDMQPSLVMVMVRTRARVRVRIKGLGLGLGRAKYIGHSWRTCASGTHP